jgi:hypothetical protein
MGRSAIGDHAKDLAAKRDAKHEWELAQLQEAQRQTEILQQTAPRPLKRAVRVDAPLASVGYEAVGTDIPPLPTLLEPGGPEGKAAWDLDWQNITTMVKHILLLRSVLNATIEAHKAEGVGNLKPKSTAPRVRAAEIITILEPLRDRYMPILKAIAEAIAMLPTLRRWSHAPYTHAPSISPAIAALRKPLHSLATLPPAVATVDPEDRHALRTAMEAAERVEALVRDVWNAPDAFRQALRGVVDGYDRLADKIADNDARRRVDGFNVDCWGTTPPAYPIQVIIRGEPGESIVSKPEPALVSWP